MNDFEEYMNYFRSLSEPQQKRELFDQTKFLAIITSELSNAYGKEDEVIINKDIIEWNDVNISQFYEALLVLISSSQKSLAKYIDSVSANLEDKINEGQTKF